MSILWSLAVRLAVGVVTKLLVAGRDPGGVIPTALLGVGRALAAGFVGLELGWFRPDEATGIIASTLGAMVLLLGYRFAIRVSDAVSRGRARVADGL